MSWIWYSWAWTYNIKQNGRMCSRDSISSHFLDPEAPVVAVRCTVRLLVISKQRDATSSVSVCSLMHTTPGVENNI